MAYEVELGLHVKELASVRKKLKSLGAEFIKKERKVMVYYWLPEDLTGCLRLDVWKDACFLVYKKGDLVSGHKEEQELKVGDARTTHEILCGLGYNRPLMRQRIAEFYKLDGVNVTLRDDTDETHIEIEKVITDKTLLDKTTLEIEAMMKKLGFSHKDRYTREEIQTHIKTDIARWKRTKSELDFDEVYRFVEEAI